MTVLDIGCAPGSWCQVVIERCRLKEKPSTGYLLGIDLQVVPPIPGADIMSMSDITTSTSQHLISQKLRGRRVDLVLSDMAPSPSGDPATDHLRLTNLCRTVFHFFSPTLESKNEPLFSFSSDGSFLCKMWDGAERKSFMVVLAAGEAVAKALTRAVKEEIRQSQQSATRYASKTGQSASETKENANANARMGITLEESLQILNVKTPIDPKEVEKNYEHLFSINDKTKGGSFYLQSKVYRAKERIDEELRRQGTDFEKRSRSEPGKQNKVENGV